jgi:Mce-associated membrane protein
VTEAVPETDIGSETSTVVDAAPEADAAPEPEVTPEPEIAPEAEPTRRVDPVRLVAIVLLAVSVLFAAFGGWYWLSAPRVTSDAQVRDQALGSGEQAVLNFNTLDYHHVDAGVSLWLASSTGSLHASIVAGKTAFEQQIVKAQTTTSARILDAALTSLNVSAGKATVLVAIQLTVTPAHGTASTKQSRLVGTLARTSSGWKLSGLSQVPVSAAGQ